MDPVSLIFAGVAIFFVYKLISVLGTRTGHEQRQEIEGLQRASRAKDAASGAEAGPRTVTEKAPRPVSPAAASLREADPEFDEPAFLDGAKGAYEMIVEAFAAGDLKSVKRYLAASVHDAFKRAIADRETAGSRFELKFIGVDSASIRSSRVENGSMIATVDFASNQVRVTYSANGDVIDGDPNRVDLVRDAWTFSRSVRSSDPNWTLVATGAAA
ncbi:MAG: Tim44/TimA family putative adaptor protein [Alphaproteobacteria bacterium]|nr:Tim44/TimA family putative adaptor protein [Alphaproteobacteria bacterium]